METNTLSSWVCKAIVQYITSISIHLLLRMNAMLDFICMGFAELWGKEYKTKNSK